MSMKVKGRVAHHDYEKLREALAGAFPSAKHPITDPIVDGVVIATWAHWQPGHAALGVPTPTPDEEAQARSLLPTISSSTPYKLYDATAHHKRTLRMESTAPMQSEFEQTVPMVRVPLPQSLGSSGQVTISTPIGEVYLGSDHLLGSIDLIASKYSDNTPLHLDYTPARVDLITPARLAGSRFGAIAVYLGYRNASDTTPSFYLLEAGTATGEAAMIYFGRTMTTQIVQRSWYKPTAFAGDHNTYTGTFTVVGDEPSVMSVRSHAPGLPDYIQVTITYAPSGVSLLPPALLTLIAALRIALIGETQGITVVPVLQPILASLGSALPWIISPHLGP